MLLPILDLKQIILNAVDFLIVKEYPFTCFDITRQLSVKFDAIDHNFVRKTVEDYLFGDGKKPTNSKIKSCFGYKNEIHYGIHGSPQVYMPAGSNLSSYNKDFLDPTRTELPKLTLKQKLGKAFQSGKSEEEIVKMFKEHLGEVNSAPVTKTGKVYVLYNKDSKEFAGKSKYGGRRPVKALKEADIWTNKNGPTQTKVCNGVFSNFEPMALDVCGVE